MGLTVVVDNTLCYLISNKDDEVFAFPRKIMEPELRALRPQINHLGFTLPDEEASHYLSSTPWGGYLKTKKPSFKTCEEQVRLLIVKKINQVNCLSAIYLKTDFEKADSLWSDPSNVTTPDYFNFTHYGAKQLVNFLEAFCWVSKTFEVDCVEVGGGKDYDFQILEKASFSFLGRKGNPLFIFRWSEFKSMQIKDYTKFNIETTHGSWGATMGRKGFSTHFALPFKS